MKKKRFGLIFGISLIAMLVMVLGLAAAASAADSAAAAGSVSAPAAQKAPSANSVVVTLTDVSAWAPYNVYTNGIPVYFDHNEGAQTPYYGGGWIGVLVTNTLGVPQSVQLLLYETDPYQPFPSHSPSISNVNTFRLGKGQVHNVTISDIPPGEGQIYYYYIFTPRFKNDPAGTCEIFDSPSTRGDCGTKHFRLLYNPLGGGFPDFVDGTLVMDRVQTANPGAIESVQEEGSSTFTLTVYFESGNLCTASGSCSATFNPTTYYDYDASVMHLISVSAIATDTDGTKYTPINRMRLEAPVGSINLNQDPVKFTYIFARDKNYSVTFNPSYAANSGSDNYKGGADMEGVPTAITLLDLEAAPVQPLTLAAAAAVFLLGTASILVLRKRQRE